MWYEEKKIIIKRNTHGKKVNTGILISPVALATIDIWHMYEGCSFILYGIRGGFYSVHLGW